jgi:SNF2 family DNA or RNA helicase
MSAVRKVNHLPAYDLRMSNGVVKGALVKHDGFEAFGVVLNVSEGIANVLFDDSEIRNFADLNSLSRVEFGDRVLQFSSQKVGIKTGRVEGETPKWKVIFDINENAVEIFEADLRPYDPLDPFERALQKDRRGGTIDEVLISTSSHYLRNEHVNNDLVSLDGARVDVQPHQISVAHRVVTSHPHRFLLCDEVGLGKTIEAGMILKELRARGEAKRVLIIVPATLTRQWQFELKSKFNEVFPIFDSKTFNVVLSENPDENPFSRRESVIVSKDWISHPSRAGLVTETAWDLVIVDEAHHARSHASQKSTRLYKVVSDLTDIVQYPDRAVLFLTATPMQLSSHELYSLVEMIDPALFASEEGFNGHRSALPELNELASSISQASDLSQLPNRNVNLLSTWLEISREEAQDLLNTGDREYILGELGKKHLLTEVLIRNRKAKVLGFKERKAHRWNVELTQKERDVVELIEQYVEDGYRNAASANINSIGFLMTTYQKMTASSLQTIRDSLNRRLTRLQGAQTEVEIDEEDLAPLLEDLDEDPDEGLRPSARTAPAVNQTETERIKEIISLLDEIKIDSKAEALVKNMEELAQSPVPKVLIFTEYRGTQEYLAKLLRGAGWNVNVFHGSQSSQQKDASVDAFKNGVGRQVLISTEAGAEGRNFQFCHMLINYDLPWNPMTVEQRIGRIDRMGQENTVMVFNFCVKDSIEERVLDVLERRINMFEVTVGGLDPILGEVAGDLREIMQKARDERDAAIEVLGERLANQVSEARKADAKLQDFFMDTKSYAVSIAEKIAGQKGAVNAAVQEKYMKTLLKVHNTYIKRHEDLKEYEVVFHDPFLRNNPNLFKHPQDRQRRVVFRSDERPDSDYVQYLAFGHPVIDAAVREVCSPRWPGTVGSRVLKSGSDLTPTTGWLLVYEIEVSDVRNSSIFAPIYVDDTGICDRAIGEELVKRALSSTDEVVGEITSEGRAHLKSAKQVADGEIDKIVTLTVEQLLGAATEKVDRETDRVKKYYSKLKQNCEKRIETTTLTLERLADSDDQQQRRIIPVWQKRLADDKERLADLEIEQLRRLAQVGALRNPSCTPRLLQVTRIAVID